jgi:hypothetical protein
MSPVDTLLQRPQLDLQLDLVEELQRRLEQALLADEDEGQLETLSECGARLEAVCHKLAGTAAVEAYRPRLQRIVERHRGLEAMVIGYQPQLSQQLRRSAETRRAASGYRSGHGAAPAIQRANTDLTA